MSDSKTPKMPHCPNCHSTQFDIEYTHLLEGLWSEVWVCEGCGECYGDTEENNE